MLPQLLTDALEAHKDKWGTQYFVEITIGVNIAVFTIEQLGEYAAVIRRWAKDKILGAKLNWLDQQQAAGAAMLTHQCFHGMTRCHPYVWWTCKLSAYWCAAYGLLVLYRDDAA